MRTHSTCPWRTRSVAMPRPRAQSGHHTSAQRCSPSPIFVVNRPTNTLHEEVLKQSHFFFPREYYRKYCTTIHTSKSRYLQASSQARNYSTDYIKTFFRKKGSGVERIER